MKSRTAVIYGNVRIGKKPEIEDFVVLGKPPQGERAGELELVLGDFTILRTHTIIYAGNIIGDNFQTGDSARIREYNEIGDSVVIGAGSMVETHCIIEDNVRIHSNCYIPEHMHIEKNAWIGPGVVMVNTTHPPCPASNERKFPCVNSPLVKRRAKIGAGCVILPGVTIGEKALIGAGSVVSRDIPANSVAYGNPARVRKTIDELVCKPGLFERVYGWEENWKKRLDGKWMRR